MMEGLVIIFQRLPDHIVTNFKLFFSTTMFRDNIDSPYRFTIQKNYNRYPSHHTIQIRIQNHNIDSQYRRITIHIPPHEKPLGIRRMSTPSTSIDPGSLKIGFLVLIQNAGLVRDNGSNYSQEGIGVENPFPRSCSGDSEQNVEEYKQKNRMQSLYCILRGI